MTRHLQYRRQEELHPHFYNKQEQLCEIFLFQQCPIFAPLIGNYLLILLIFVCTPLQWQAYAKLKISVPQTELKDCSFQLNSTPESEFLPQSFISFFIFQIFKQFIINMAKNILTFKDLLSCQTNLICHHIIIYFQLIYQFYFFSPYIIFIFIYMTARYKDNTFHMLQTFNNTAKRNTGFGMTSESKTQNLRGKNGSTWDAMHMTNFINQSHYSNWSQSRSASSSTHYPKQSKSSTKNDHFFRTTKDNKNASKFGYTKINPLVSLPQTKNHNFQVLRDYLQKQSPQRYVLPKHPLRNDGSFKFEGNSVKFRVTDPLTLQYMQQKKPSGFDKQRLKWLISRRHPHGMTGVDHPESQIRQFYSQNIVQSPKVRQEPNSYRTHLIDRDWRSKARVNQTYKQEYGFPKGKLIQERKFRNDDTHGFNIVTNCQSER